MEGWLSLNAIPQFQDLGSCNLEFDNDCHEALSNLLFDLSGTKGKGLKRLKEILGLASE